MRICIVIQSESFLQSAGMRIRYNRMMQAVDPDVAEVDTTTIDDLKKLSQFDHDVYVISKCFSVDALILGHALKGAGKIVGQDVFDDYFSQHGDPRLARYRMWLRESAHFTDFVLCTTERMRDVLEPYFPAVSVTAIPDPVHDYDPLRLVRTVEAKVARMRARREVRVLWFGIGDNPFFPVGLVDLVAQADELARLQRRGWTVALTVQTNLRALSAQNLKRLRQLPFPVSIAEWSETVETAGLRNADLTFIPVSAQSFSRAKSLNRAVTALIECGLVLSRGYPLYEQLHPFIYRSADALIADLENGRSKLTAESISSLTTLLLSSADPHSGAGAFIAAARAAGPRRDAGRPVAQTQNRAPTLCLVHGIASLVDDHKMVTRLDGLSVRSPFARDGLNFDVRFELTEAGMEVWVAKRRLESLSPVLSARSEAAETILGQAFVRIASDAFGPQDAVHRRSALSGHFPARAASYGAVMDWVVAACRLLFPHVPVVVSENDGNVMALTGDGA